MQDFKPEPNSREWEAFERWLQAELTVCYRKLASLDATPAQTEQERGKAAFITRLLSLKNSPVNFGPATTDY